MEYLSHKEQYEHSVRKACHMFKKLQEMPHGSMDNFRFVFFYITVFLFGMRMQLYCFCNWALFLFLSILFDMHLKIWSETS